MTAPTETVPTETAPPHPPPALAFARTIDRGLVHRAAVSEVLVTDLVRTGPEEFLAGAQLPLGHAYFSDHARTPVTYDFLLLLEAARQAGTAASHHQLGIVRDTVFLVNNWSVRIEDLPALAPGERPAELALAGVVTPVHAAGGRLKAVGSSVELALGGRVVARTRIDVGVAAGADYAKLRYFQRRSAPPLTSELTGSGRGVPADPASVGRRDPANVVVGEPDRLADGSVRARVEPLFGNRSLFDHTYDHIPAMVLTEAARQLAHLAGVPTDRAVVGCDAVFTRFTELDLPLVATARRVAGPTGGGDGTGDGSGNGSGGAFGDAFEVVFEQDGVEAGRIALDFAPAPGPLGGTA
ncbi:AfsA-related hotdog domain-containing protein [Streptomyces sp. JNUCC 64]